MTTIEPSPSTVEQVIARLEAGYAAGSEWVAGVPRADLDALVAAVRREEQQAADEREADEWMNAPMGKPVESAPALVPVQLGAIYTDALVLARATARTHGYALAVHGSQMRDFDLIAVPWVEEASAPEMLVEAIRKAVNGTYSAGSQAGNDIITKQPHGRLTWAIHLEGVDRGLKDALVAGKVPFHPYLDLSVMPPARPLRGSMDAAVLAAVRNLSLSWGTTGRWDNSFVPEVKAVLDALWEYERGATVPSAEAALREATAEVERLKVAPESDAETWHKSQIVGAAVREVQARIQQGGFLGDPSSLARWLTWVAMVGAHPERHEKLITPAAPPAQEEGRA